MTMVAYDVKFHTLSKYDTLLVTIEEERICIFIRRIY